MPEIAEGRFGCVRCGHVWPIRSMAPRIWPGCKPRFWDVPRLRPLRRRHRPGIAEILGPHRGAALRATRIRGFGPVRAFGSLRRSDARPSSDVDLPADRHSPSRPGRAPRGPRNDPGSAGGCRPRGGTSLAGPAPSALRGGSAVMDEARLAEIVVRIDRIVRATAAGRSAFIASDMVQHAVVRTSRGSAKPPNPRRRGRERTGRGCPGGRRPESATSPSPATARLFPRRSGTSWSRTGPESGGRPRSGPDRESRRRPDWRPRYGLSISNVACTIPKSRSMVSRSWRTTAIASFIVISPTPTCAVRQTRESQTAQT